MLLHKLSILLAIRQRIPFPSATHTCIYICIHLADCAVMGSLKLRVAKMVRKCKWQRKLLIVSAVAFALPFLGKMWGGLWVQLMLELKKTESHIM